MIRNALMREGGFVHHPSDRGGPTKYGITLATLEAWRGRKLEAADVAAMPSDEAVAIYKSEYLEKPNFDKIAASDLRELVFDTGINHGRSRASRWLQESVNRCEPDQRLIVDGVIGQKSLAIINRTSPKRLYVEFLSLRYIGFATFVRDNPEQRVFLVGWINRTNEFLARLA